MSSVGRLPGAVADALARGAVVVTANQRAAHTLRREFERTQRAAGLGFWEPPKILVWGSWTAGLWQGLLLEGKAERMLLSELQERQIWRAAIEGDAGRHGSLESEGALAEMAAEAWRLICAYRCEGRWGSNAVSEDVRAFRRWEAGFRSRCEAGRYLSAAGLEEALRESVEDGELALGVKEILLAGFDTMTPAQTALLEALQESGVEVGEAVLEQKAKLFLVEAEEGEAELRLAAGWVRERLNEARDEVAPRIAVILPSPGEERSAIERVFREVLSPELVPITAGAKGGPYEFSLGQPLGRVAMVRTAMDLLRWARGPMEMEAVSRVVLSPFFAARGVAGVDVGDEAGARAEFDAFRLRKLGMLRPEIGLHGMMRAIESSKWAGRLGGLLGQLRGLERTAGRLLHGEGGGTSGADQQRGAAEVLRSFGDWSDVVRELLDAAGWATVPGPEAEAESVAFQVRRRFEGALDELATLDFEGGRRGFSEAVEVLETVLESTVFAPESREAAVQIMGPLEAAGSEFDAVWFLGASEVGWPRRFAVNPLLGWPLQREMGMPGADLEADREHALEVTRRIARSAPTVVFSYARRRAETPEVEERRSTLLGEFAFAELDELGLPGREAEEDVIALEAVAEDVWIPLANPAVGGGASVLQAQAACGFRAFAERRLWSTGIERSAPGLDAGERGDLVHVALERFWETVRTQDALRAMSFEARDAALGEAVGAALKRVERREEVGTTAWERAFLETQRERLMRLLRPWLEHELARPLPFSVRQREADFADVAIGPLRLHVRMDRVDETTAGDVLIDYKTGMARPVEWGGERPDQPQLPLYAVLSERELGAVAFARVQPGKTMGLDGFVAGTGVLAKAAESEFETLAEQVEEWRGVLVRLAEEFAAGDARVRPKSYPKTCLYCAQRLLCRLDPALLEEQEEPEGDLSEENDG